MIKLYDGAIVKLSDDSTVKLKQWQNPTLYMWCYKMDDAYSNHPYFHQSFREDGIGYHDMNVVQIIE